MARLSEESHKNTPINTSHNKSGLLKKMVRNRLTSTLDSASAKGPDRNSLLSPSVKPGFELVGLLPSERTSLELAKRMLDNNGGTSVREAIEKDMDALYDFEMPRKENAALISSSEFNTMLGSRSASGTEFPTRGTTQAVASSKRQDDESSTGVWESKNYYTSLTNAVADKNKDQSLENDDAFIEFDHECGPNHSSTFNTQKAKDSLNQRAGEHATINSTKGFKNQLFNTNPAKLSVAIQSKLIICPPQVYPVTKMDDDDVSLLKTKDCHVLATPKSIGPFKITDSVTAMNLQMIVIFIYVSLVLFSALIGPKTFLLTLWRMGVLVSIYSATIHYLNGKIEMLSDIFLAPICFIICEASNKATEIFEKLLAKFQIAREDATQSSENKREVDELDFE